MIPVFQGSRVNLYCVIVEARSGTAAEPTCSSRLAAELGVSWLAAAL